MQILDVEKHMRVKRSSIKKLWIVILLITGSFAFKQEKKHVLIIGDSISLGYFPFVREALQEEAIVVHNPGNAQHTGTGLDSLASWLKETHLDVIHFNWGLWDLCYRNPSSTNEAHRDKLKGTVQCTPEQYRKNLDSLVYMLQRTGAKLIFATTTMVPPDELGRFAGDEKKYNTIALEIMRKYAVQVDDINKISYDVHKRSGLGEGNVHYKVEGYKELAIPVIQSIRKALLSLNQPVVQQ